MSDIQTDAGNRWLFLCLMKEGTASFDDVRDLVPKFFQLSEDEQLLSWSRAEPAWMTAMRNFKRDVAAGKHRYFVAIPNGLQLVLKGLGSFPSPQ